MNKNKFKPFDTAEFLDSEETIAEYISGAMESGNQDTLIEALSNVARARGMTRLAESTGLGRESLYKALRPGSKPRYETIVKIISALNVKIKVVPAYSQQRGHP